MYRDADKADEFVSIFHDNREYRKLLDEGFTPDEAKQWLEQRAKGIETLQMDHGIVAET